MNRRLINSLILLLIMICILAISGCSGNSAEELFKTAQFEELQSNREHAEQLYREIIEKYPESEYARKAEDQLLKLR